MKTDSLVYYLVHVIMNYCCTIELHKLIRYFLPCTKGELNLQHAKCSFTLVLSYPEDGKRRSVQNVGTSEQKYTASHRKLYLYHEDRGNELLWNVYRPACLPDCTVSANDVHLNINRIEDFKFYIKTCLSLTFLVTLWSSIIESETAYTDNTNWNLRGTSVRRTKRCCSE